MKKKKSKPQTHFNYWIVIPDTQLILEGATKFGEKYEITPYRFNVAEQICYATLTKPQIEDLHTLIPGSISGFDLFYGPEETCYVGQN